MDHETQTLQIGHTLVEIIAYATVGNLPRVSMVFTPANPAFTPEQTRTLTNYLKIAANLAECKARNAAVARAAFRTERGRHA